MPEKVTFFRGMSSWIGFEAKSISFAAPGRAEGSTRWNFLRLMGLAINGITSFSALPLHAVTVMGVLFLFFSIALGLQTLYMYLSGQSIDGFTTVILLMLIVGATLAICVGILGLYLSRIYQELKARPRYIIERSMGPGFKKD